jgi:polysaccharide pyruvyl transferase WcaK-like protein
MILNERAETTITIANWAGVNTGDDAIFSALLSALRSTIPGKLRIFVLSDNEGEIDRKYSIDGAAPIFEYYRPENLFRVLGFLRRSDLVIYGGGDLLNGDLTSLSFLRMAKLLGVPVVCCGVGALPIENPLQRALARSALNSLDLITLRDPDSMSRLEELGVTRVPTRLTADLAFLLLPKLHVDHLTAAGGNGGASMTVGLNVRTQDPMYRFYSQWDEDGFLDTITLTCNNLIEELDAHILFLPMETCGRGKEYHHQIFDDMLGRRVLDKIDRKDRFSVLEKEYAPDELKGLLSQLDLLIAMRLHTLLIASDQGIPMIAFDYAPKLRSFMSSIGREDYLIPTENLDGPTIMTAVRKAISDDGWKDRGKVQALCLRSQENIRLIVDLLNEGRKSKGRFFAFLPLVPAFVLSNLVLDVEHSIRNMVRGEGPADG